MKFILKPSSHGYGSRALILLNIRVAEEPMKENTAVSGPRMSSAVAVCELRGSLCPIKLFDVEKFLTPTYRSKVRCMSISYNMCGQVHSSL